MTMCLNSSISSFIKLKIYKILFILFLSSISFSTISAQALDSLLFESHVNLIDSTTIYEGIEEGLLCIDSLQNAYVYDKYQKNYINLLKGGLYANNLEDSLATSLIRPVENYLDSQKDTNHVLLAILLDIKSSIAFQNDEYDQAIEYIEQSIKIRKRQLGDDHPEYFSALSWLAFIHMNLGQYQESESLYLQCKKGMQNYYGENHPTFAELLFDMASLYSRMSLFEKAESNYQKTLSIRKKVFGKFHKVYSLTLINTASLYTQMGKFEESEQLYTEALSINEQLGDNSGFNHAHALSGFGWLYSKMGQYEKAVKPLQQSIDLYDQIFGPSNLYSITPMNDLAIIHKRLGNYEKAESISSKLVDTWATQYGKENVTYPILLNNLANIYTQTKEYDKAESIYLEALQISKKMAGEKSVSYGDFSANLASIYLETKDYEKAESKLLIAQEIQKDIKGTSHPDYANVLHKLGNLYEQTEQFEMAAKVYTEANDITKLMLENAFTFMSEKEKQLYHKRSLVSFSNVKALGFKHKSQEFLASLYNSILYEKGLHLNSSIQTKQFVFAQKDSSLLSIYNQLNETKQRLYNQYQLPLAQRDDTQVLNNEITDLEKQLAKASNSFRLDQALNNINMPEIAEKLQKGEVAIEFSRYFNTHDSIGYYAACVVDHMGKLDYVALTTEDELLKKLNINGVTDANYVNALYGQENRGLVVSQDQTNLYELVWQPIDSILNEVHTIYYSPTGYLNRLNLNAIGLDEETVLADKYKMIEMFSTRSIALQDEKSYNNIAYTVGGVQYENLESDGSANAANSKDLAYADISRNNKVKSWNYLRWTQKETETINSLLADNQFEIWSRTGNQATEEDFKSLGTDGPSPRFIHLATHGYFLPKVSLEEEDPDQRSFRLSDHPLLRSGLILSDGNAAWLGLDTGNQKEDGILTAYEVSGMNLSNTELVVLSACETGLGEITSIGDVYGLQRSFRMAGVKYLIMSLWQVPDRATSLFMTSFYSNYLGKNLSISEAFNKTQLEMRDRFFDPYDWAGFVLIE